MSAGRVDCRWRTADHVINSARRACLPSRPGKNRACVAVPPAVCRRRAAVLSVRPPLPWSGPWSGATRPVAQINSR